MMTRLSDNTGLSSPYVLASLPLAMALFYDRAEISGRATITREGYFVADALVARANNIQNYRAGELGLTDRDANDTVRVFRPESAVFAVDSLASASRLPITLGHPVKNGVGVMVDARNWSEFAKGETGEEILRDGEFIRVPIRVTDAPAVDTVQRDHQEFSLGYAAKISLQDGEFDGQAYDAVLSDIRYNHLAACRAARGGPELRITDERTDPPSGVQPVTIALIDGLPVNLADATAAKTAVEKIIAERDAYKMDIGARDATITENAATIVARDAEIVTLKAAVDAAKVTPAQMRDAAAGYARTVASAKKLGATITDAMDEPAVKRAAVSLKMGDAAKDYSDDHVAVAFDTLVAALPADKGAPPTPVRDALGEVIGDAANVTDARTAFADARAKRMERLSGAYREPAATGTGA